MINKYEQTKAAAYIKTIEGMLDYWRNELERIESEPVAISPAKPTAEEIDKIKKSLNEAIPKRKPYQKGGVVCPNPEPNDELKLHPAGSPIFGMDFGAVEGSITVTSRRDAEGNWHTDICGPLASESATSNDGVNWTPTKRGVKAMPANYIEEAGPIETDVFDKLKTVKNAKPDGPTKLSIASLWELFKVRNKLKDPIDSGHAIVFAKYIRELTIDETVLYMHAEPEPPGSTAGDWTANAFLVVRPDKDNINLPKDYQI